MRILLQFPEGLKQEALMHSAPLEAEGHEVLLSASSCYGACDLCLDEASAVGADKIIHFGHAEFMPVKSKIQIEYVPYFATVNWSEKEKMLSRAISFLKEIKAKRVSLVFPVQHVKNSEHLKEYLEANGIHIEVGKGGDHTRFPGQVLGCDGTAANVPSADAVLYFGGGKFHPTGIASGKPVLCADPHLTTHISSQMKLPNLKKGGKARFWLRQQKGKHSAFLYRQNAGNSI